MLTGILVMATLAGLIATALILAAGRVRQTTESPIKRVNDLLPQTQCAQCGYPGCRPYAQAIVSSDAAINLCPPGGDATIQRLAELLGKEALALAEPAPAGRSVAIIDEALCIGCTHCRNACPVDAIVGAHQLMHTIIESECTGCELCIAPCPVDCISLRPIA